ncbi:hypothetical protein [Blastopirellula retiformator]|uniref:Uncharacterized protein n=1 Tax=Blastopirellula retiformator TaxID=2527970 RepID=A0A5C5V1W6_9BACT|nr:hypothetical protein [Blastopirellula retiformator]TWT32594.1 hypothetical protein Enr8_23990 [Blastopirellula retiformator]
MSEPNPYASPQSQETGELVRAECPAGFVWSGFVDRYQFQVAPAGNLAPRIVEFYRSVGFRPTDDGPDLHFRRGHLWGSLIGAESRARQSVCVELTPGGADCTVVTLEYDVDFYFAFRYKPRWTLSPFREAVRLARTLDAINWQ